MKYSLASSSWGKEELGAIKKVMDNGRFTMGPMVQEFEKQFAERFQAENAVMVNSGSSANLLMISLLRWKKKLTGNIICLLYTSPSPRDGLLSRMPSSA